MNKGVKRLAMTEAAPVDTSLTTKIDLYKMEYKLAAERYENIFKAIWQNFSYMSAISGAVLAFGGDHLRLQLHFLWFIVCLPLVFWYWATYEPLNRYGDEAEERLKALEDEFNKLGDVRMRHFKEFESRKVAEGLSGWLRVRYIVRIFFIPLTLLFLSQANSVAKAWCNGEALVRESRSQISVVTIPLEELQKLRDQQGLKPPDLNPAPSAPTPESKD
jgi:hypothetical protein